MTTRQFRQLRNSHKVRIASPNGLQHVASKAITNPIKTNHY